MLLATHTKAPRVISVDKMRRIPKLLTSKLPEMLPETTERRQNKYLNNRIEQDHQLH